MEICVQIVVVERALLTWWSSLTAESSYDASCSELYHSDDVEQSPFQPDTCTTSLDLHFVEETLDFGSTPASRHDQALSIPVVRALAMSSAVVKDLPELRTRTESGVCFETAVGFLWNWEPKRAS